MIDTIIFDLDGTLLNTLEDLTDSVNYAMEKMGVPLHTQAEVRMMLGNSAHFLLKSAMPEGSAEEEISRCMAFFEEHYHSNLRNKTAPYEGICEMLSHIREAGYKTAVVSNKGDAFTKELVKDFFGEFIEFAVGRSERFQRKPAPDTVWYAMELLGSEKEKTAYVGDSEVDVMTARNAGIPCVSCLWGFRDRETVEKENPAVIIESPDQLLNAIKSL